MTEAFVVIGTDAENELGPIVVGTFLNEDEANAAAVASTKADMGEEGVSSSNEIVFAYTVLSTTLHEASKPQPTPEEQRYNRALAMRTSLRALCGGDEALMKDIAELVLYNEFVD